MSQFFGTKISFSNSLFVTCVCMILIFFFHRRVIPSEESGDENGEIVHYSEPAAKVSVQENHVP